MKKILYSRFSAWLFIIALTPSLVSADPVIDITFEDLQGPIAAYQDPFENLNDEQLYNISMYARVKEMKKLSPGQVTSEMTTEAENAQKALETDELDPDELFTQGQKIIEIYKEAATKTNPLLTDKKVSIPGYMLALEYQDQKVTEFLLVPYVGACSHKPVPAANQILYVKAKTPVKAGLPYLPIQVTGMLRVEQQERDLYLVDGQKEITLSYTLEDATVKAYSRPKDQSFIVE